MPEDSLLPFGIDNRWLIIGAVLFGLVCWLALEKLLDRWRRR